MNDPQIITVRDRRAKYQFSIHNRIMDDWLPIIGPQGYMLYSLYVRMANREDENSFPGYRMIQAHLGIGPATISNYNKLLTWCGLIYIEAGNNTESNDYYILDIPPVTPETIDSIRRQAVVALKSDNKFLTYVLKRLEEWKSLQAHWGRKKQRPIVIHSAQVALQPAQDPKNLDTPSASVAEHPTSTAEYPVSAAEQTASFAEYPASTGEAEQSESTIQINNPKGERGSSLSMSQPLASKPEAPLPPLSPSKTPIPASPNSQVNGLYVKAAITTFEQYHGRLHPVGDVAKREAIVDLATHENDLFDQARWTNLCRKIAIKGLKGRVDLVIQDYQAEKRLLPVGLDNEKLAAYKALQEESQRAEALRDESLKQFDPTKVTAVGVDVQRQLRQTIQKRNTGDGR